MGKLAVLGVPQALAPEPRRAHGPRRAEVRAAAARRAVRGQISLHSGRALGRFSTSNDWSAMCAIPLVFDERVVRDGLGVVVVVRTLDMVFWKATRGSSAFELFQRPFIGC